MIYERVAKAFDPHDFTSQILADQLTLSQPRGTDYAHHITTGTPGFSDTPAALLCSEKQSIFRPSGMYYVAYRV